MCDSLNLTRTPLIGNGHLSKARLFIGGICWDNLFAVDVLERGRKHPILDWHSSSGAGAANAAIGHRRLDRHARLILFANVGDDDQGHDLRRRMAEERIEMPCEPIAGVPTSVSFAIVERVSGTGTILSDLGARAVPVPLELVEQALPGAEACCLTAHAVNEQITPIVAAAARHGVPVFLGLARAQIDHLGYDGLRQALVEPVELIICNRIEAAQLTGCAEVADQLEALRFAGRARTVVITDGVNGIHAARDGEQYHVPAYTDPQRPVVDDVGAGDAAQSAIVDALLKGYPLELALLAGARQGFEACTGYGATTHLLDGEALRDYLSLATGAGAGV